MTSRRRLSADQRRMDLIDVGTEVFARQPYDAVRMDDIATRGGVSRALLYRHFPSKRDLFAAVYQRAADRLLAQTPIRSELPLMEQVITGLDTHIDYFDANKEAVLAANRTLAADPVIQSIIEGELAVLRERMLDVIGVSGQARVRLAAILRSWLTFVRALTVEWLTGRMFTRAELRDTCIGALVGALGQLTDLSDAAAET